MRLNLNTHATEELIDITTLIQDTITQTGCQDGLCHIFCKHTTAALTINEGFDPAVRRDILLALRYIVPVRLPYEHAEGNSPAHVKSSFLGASLVVAVKAGLLVLGRWQAIYFCEFDGPRNSREVEITVMPPPD